jgi:hypothetical protein
MIIYLLSELYSLFDYVHKKVNSKKQQLQHFESAGVYKLLLRSVIPTFKASNAAKACKK